MTHQQIILPSTAVYPLTQQPVAVPASPGGSIISYTDKGGVADDGSVVMEGSQGSQSPQQADGVDPRTLPTLQ